MLVLLFESHAALVQRVNLGEDIHCRVLQVLDDLQQVLFLLAQLHLVSLYLRNNFITVFKCADKIHLLRL